MLTEALTAVCILLVGRLLTRRRQPSMPPGPKGWPLIGNLLDLPTTHEWEVFAKWGEKWGKLVLCYLVILDRSMLSFTFKVIFYPYRFSVRWYGQYISDFLFLL